LVIRPVSGPDRTSDPKQQQGCRARLHVRIESMEAANLDVMLARFTEHWSPKKIARVNDYDVRIVKIQGEFTWHLHADTDEFFLVLDGRLTIQMRDRDVVLGPRELFVVPRGVEHCPRADAETAVLLFEPGTVINTGDAGGELTAEVEDLA
jgi:mannose-6-phosphate isomerase-like protein (cupin superfamily)